jgi:FixJ family two-component response regulator
MARVTTRHRPQSRIPQTSKLRVCVIDNDAATRKALEFLLDARRIPVSTFDSASDFLANWKPELTGCLVVDIRMPGMSGTDLQLELINRGYQVPLILMTGYGDVAVAVEAMSRGALHFFEKPVNYQKLLDKIDQGLKQARDQRIEAAERKEFELRFQALSPQEKNVIERVAQGMTSQEIADALNIVQGTVDLHRGKIYDKLGVGNLAELVRVYVTKRVPLHYFGDETPYAS